MNRFTFLIGEPVQDDAGAWVRYDDVEALLRIASAQAERHDRFLAALSRIAHPRGWSFMGRDAIETARKALGK